MNGVVLKLSAPLFRNTTILIVAHFPVTDFCTHAVRARHFMTSNNDDILSGHDGQHRAETTHKAPLHPEHPRVARMLFFYL